MVLAKNIVGCCKEGAAEKYFLVFFFGSFLWASKEMNVKKQLST